MPCCEACSPTSTTPTTSTVLELARRGRIERVQPPEPGADDAWLAVLRSSTVEVREVPADVLVSGAESATYSSMQAD